MMEQQGGNQDYPPNILCRMGCGFYGSPMYDGMCSKCHKDVLKRRQQSSSPTQMASGRVSPHLSVMASGTSNKSGAEAVVQVLENSVTTIPSIETASPTISTPNLPQDKLKVQDKDQCVIEGAAAVSATGSTDEDSSSEKDKKPKKNRCHTCKKKLGLTGFPCRCGGLYCGMHRYSDKHDCSFNYKELAQEEIRKNNPVIVGEKIQKI